MSAGYWKKLAFCFVVFVGSNCAAIVFVPIPGTEYAVFSGLLLGALASLVALIWEGAAG